jgi:hypothetical protein
MNFFSMHPSSPFSCRFSLIPNFTPVIIPPVALPFLFSVMCERFYSKLYEIFDLHVPLKKCTTRHYPVWFNSAIIAKIRKKSNVFKKYKRTGLPSYFLEFKNLRRDVKREIDVVFRDYISKVQENLVGDPKKFWSFVNNRKGRSRIPSRMSNGGHSLNSFSEIVNSFGTHFKNSYDTADAPANLIDVLGNATFHLYTVSDADILEFIGLLKSGLCSGDDGIPAFLIKDCKYLLLPPLRVLFNLILKSGEYSIMWKVGRVCPIFKYLSFKKDGTYPPVGVDYDFLYSRFNFTPLKVRRALDTVTFLFKLFHNKVDCSTLLNGPFISVPQISSISHRYFYVPRANTNIPNNSPSFRMCSIFNCFNDICDLHTMPLSSILVIIMCNLDRLHRLA